MRTSEIYDYFVGRINRLPDYGDFKDRREALSFLAATFRDEYGNEIWKWGRKGAFKRYIWGLPSVFSMPVDDMEISGLMRGWEVDPTDNPSERWAELMWMAFANLCNDEGVTI